VSIKGEVLYFDRLDSVLHTFLRLVCIMLFSLMSDVGKQETASGADGGEMHYAVRVSDNG